MPLTKRRLKDACKSALHKLFVCGQRLGFDFLPRHFYSEIPMIHNLSRSKHWRRPFSMIGVQGVDLDEQLEFVRLCCSDRLIERQKQGDIYRRACDRNGEGGYGPIEADFLYTFIASQRPARIVQVGCGLATAVCLMAAEESGYSPDITCIEPYPNRFIRGLQTDGRIRLVPEKVEKTDFGLLDTLDDGDLFFVDSTHTLGPAGEVTRIVLEMLPRLPKGAWVHFHDITFPYDYPRSLLRSELFFGHESALLHAFLAHSRRFRIMASMSMLHYERTHELSELLPNYRPAGNDCGLAAGPGHFPSSTYLRVVG